MLRLTVAQINPTIGDIDGNLALMSAAAHKAASEGSQMVVFPELSLTGYYPGDLLDEPGFLAEIERGLTAALHASRETPDLYWVIGAPVTRSGPGKRLLNALLVLHHGKEVLRYAKQLLPTYSVFDERRHFEPGLDVARILKIGSTRVGFMICEDGWNDSGTDYAVNPIERLADAAPDLVVSINASPSNLGKREQRHTLFAAASRRNRLPILYVHQVGGHDQLVFDGASFAATPESGVVFEAKRFEDDVLTLVFENGSFLQNDCSAFSTPVANALSPMTFYRKQIVLGLRDYARRCGFHKAVIGCSGGIDSALTLALAVEALGNENVTAITMPSRFSSESSISDSDVLCRNLGIELLTHPIRDIVSAFEAGFSLATGSAPQGLTLENLQARVRGSILMEFSNAHGHLLLTTGNKSEISVGYCTLYGDTNGGLGLIGDLYKTEVFDLCRHINAAEGREVIPRTIIDKEPSAELAPGQKDTDSLPPYEVLDDILKHLIEGERLGESEQAIVQSRIVELTATEIGRALIARIKGMIGRNEYKRRQSPPILRLRSRAFGSGRQMPIAARHIF
jgi:NAD+ synthase (glutamine-hydrolysing)